MQPIKTIPSELKRFKLKRNAESYLDLIEPIMEKAILVGDLSSVKKKIQKLPEPLQVLAYIYTASGDLYNGGYLQYFYNSFGFMAPDVKASLIAIGDKATAKNFEKAMSEIGAPWPSSREKMIKRLTRLGYVDKDSTDLNYEKGNPFTKLEDEFYKRDERSLELTNKFAEKYCSVFLDI